MHYRINKPRYNRSKLKIIRGKEAQSISSCNIGLLAIDRNSHWRSPISKETFDELVERGLLSAKQIEHYHKRRESEYTKNPKGLKTAGAKAKKHKNYALIAEIAECDLTTIEGLEAFKRITERDLEALDLITEAQKLRASSEK